MYNNTTTTRSNSRTGSSASKESFVSTDERVLRYGLTSEQDYGNTYDITDLRQAYPANDLWYHKNRVIREKELFVLVFPQDSVRQVTMPHQLDRTSVFLAQPFLGDIRSRVIMQSLVYTSDIFHHRQNRTDIMGNQDDSALFIDLFQELIKTRLESFIHIRIRLIQDQYLRTGDNRTPQ